jgi:23S rRNA (uracil1939-C5)-methyltransferase
MTPRKQITSQRRAKQAAKKHSAGRKSSGKHTSGAKQAAEKGLGLSEIPQKHPAGAKAQRLLSGICGTTKVVPCYKTDLQSSFSATNGAHVPIDGSTRGLKPRLPFDSQLVQNSHLVQIDKPLYGGAFLARLEGKAVFVPLTLPGEQARVRITQSKSAYATAEAEEILRAAPERIAPACPHFGACGGCHYQHADYASQLAFKQAILRETLLRGGVDGAEEIAVLSGEQWGYRNRIRLALDAAEDPGYRGRRSHAVVPIRECPIAAPLLVEAALVFAEVARQFAPALRPTEVSLFCNPGETALLATVFTENQPKLRFDEFANALHERIPALIGAELVVEGSLKLQSQAIARWGASSLDYRVAGFDYRVDHGAFFQVNRWLVDSLVESVVGGHQGKLAWDLFAGVGLFARQLAARFDGVVAVESASASTQALASNLKGTTGLPVSGETLHFLRFQATRCADGAPVPDLIVLDPPRTGLGAEICALLAKITAPTLVCVSCDPATLARDLRALVASGYRIQSITLVDLFPQTFHLETVVQLRRA